MPINSFVVTARSRKSRFRSLINLNRMSHGRRSHKRPAKRWQIHNIRARSRRKKFRKFVPPLLIRQSLSQKCERLHSSFLSSSQYRLLSMRTSCPKEQNAHHSLRTRPRQHHLQAINIGGMMISLRGFDSQALGRVSFPSALVLGCPWLIMQ